MIVEGQVGPRVVREGSENILRTGITGCLNITEGHGRYYEAVSRGFCFSAAAQAGVTTQAGLSATTPALTLYNPGGSGVNAELIWAGATFTVAFAAAAVVWLAANVNISAAAVTGTAFTARNCLLGNAKAPNCFVYTAATLPAAPVAVSVLGVGLTGAITTAPEVQNMGREYSGMFILYPGSAVSIQTSTASGASGTFCEYIWEEIPV